MKLRQLAGRTYAIESDFASLGIYRLDQQNCLLIDSGHSAAHARETLRILEEQGWAVGAIFNTHGHADHCGGNHWLQEKTGCDIYASRIEAAFIENPLLLPYSTYSAYPPKLLMGKFFMPQPSRVTRIVEPGPLLINNTSFEALPLTGHSLGQMGLITPDGVLFAGDSLVSEQILEALPFVFLADVARQIITLQRLKDSSYKHIYLSHGGLSQDAAPIIKANYNTLTDTLAQIEDIIRRPHSLEGVISRFTSRLGSVLNRNHYFRLSNAISAILAYMVNQGQVSITMENNIPHYCVSGKKGSCS